MLLTNTTHTLELTTLGTTTIDSMIMFDVLSQNGAIPNVQTTQITTATTTVILNSPSVSEQKEIKTMSIKNNGVVSNSIIIKYNNGTTQTEIIKITLQAQESIIFTKESGFKVLTINGEIKKYETNLTLENFLSKPLQAVNITKVSSRTTLTLTPFSVFDLIGSPSGGVLAGTSTTVGVVPTDSTAGFPNITNFTTGNGFISNVEITNSVTSKIVLFDCLFKAGAYAFNSNVALTGQPSYSSRLPNSSYTGLELWLEAVTAFTGNLSINVTYTNENGTTGRTTGTIALGVAPTIGRLIQLPLQAGDKGIQKIDNVVATVSTAGTFNLLVMRKLNSSRIPIAGAVAQTGLNTGFAPVIYDTSAIYMAVQPDSTASGLPDVKLTIAG